MRLHQGIHGRTKFSVMILRWDGAVDLLKENDLVIVGSRSGGLTISYREGMPYPCVLTRCSPDGQHDV